MTAPRLFLLEIGTEEIPARMVQPALRDLALGLFDEIVAGGLAPKAGFDLDRNFRVFGTPRRLAAQVSGLLDRQPDAVIELTGPAIRTAFDAQGRPTRAAEGFARAHGVALSDLRTIATPKGECIGVRKSVRGRSAAEVLAEAVPRLLASMTFPKMMRWGNGENRFVRPVHSLVALLGADVIDLSFAGVRSGRRTFARRFAGTSRPPLPDAASYPEVLRQNGVLADVVERRRAIAQALESAARATGGRIAPPAGAAGEGDPELLEEITHLVEWPVVIAGEFDPAYLDLPAEVLITAMRHHQRYFSLLDRSGNLLNRFLTVANAQSDRSGAIRRGNEWVLRARLADARFFWQEDRKSSLADRTALLERVAFHEKLGSYALKVARVSRLIELIAPAFAEAGLPLDRDIAARAAALCKSDLTTQMVREFPELQGIVGGLYAEAEGLDGGVSRAIYTHYLPAGADDPVPPTPEGSALSLADRLDTQAGIFLLGVVPTGSRDPYAVRRSVHGVCRILIEKKVHLPLSRALEQAFEGYAGRPIQGAPARDQARAALLEFYRGRLDHLGLEARLRQDSVRAALAASIDDPCDARFRMEALEAFRRDARFEPLVLAHKRIKNILRDQPPGRVEPGALRERAERDLFAASESARPRLEAAARGHDHAAALSAIADLAPAVDRFFTEVMVMADDRRLRANRLALLQTIAALLLRVADFSEIVLEGQPAAAREAG